MRTNDRCPICGVKGKRPKVIPQLVEDYKGVMICNNKECERY